MNSLLNRENWNKAQGWYSNGVRVAWFDRRTRCWITHLIDGNRNQVGAADYFGHRDHFTDCERDGHFSPERDAAELNELLHGEVA